MGIACPPGRSFAIDQVSRLLALPMEYRRIALSKEGLFGWRLHADLLSANRTFERAS